MSTYTKKRGFSSVEKKAFEKKQTLNLAEFWQENRFRIMRLYLKANPMEFNYVPEVLKYSYERKRNSYEISLSRANNGVLGAVSYLTSGKIALDVVSDEIKSLKLKKFQILEAKVFLRLVGLLHSGYSMRILEKYSYFLRPDLTHISWQGLRNKLSEIKEKTDNEYLKIACTVLSLPQSVFREILWRKNVDFDSFESFLRRLKPEQIEALEDADYEFFVLGKVPSIFSEDKLFRKMFKKQFSYDELLSQEIDFDTKYLSKGAWSYDLFNMDFGYGRYPNGLTDDTEETERDLSRFISIKNHVNDFVVNKRDGIYFWLYKKARSNYVYHPNRDVKMSTHICPGFWYTLIMHLMFWVISPAAIAYIQLINPEPTLTFSYVTIVALASFTWILVGAAIFKVILISLGKSIIWLLEKYEAKKNSLTEEEEYRQAERREKIAKLAKKVGAVLKYVGLVLVVIGAITIVLGVLVLFASVIFVTLSQFFSVSKSIFITSVISYFLGYILWHKAEFSYSPRFYKWPKHIKILLFSTLAYMLADVVQYFAASIIHFFVFLTSFWYMLAFTAFVYLSSSKFLTYLEKRVDEKLDLEMKKDFQEKSGYSLSWKVYSLISYLFFFSLLAFWLVALTYAIYKYSHLFAYITLVILAFVSFFFGSIYLSKKLLVLSPKAKRLEKNMGLELKGITRADKYLLKNLYINALGDDEQRALRQQIHTSIMKLCDTISMNYGYSSIELKIYKYLDSQVKMNRFFNLVESLEDSFKERDSYENSLFINKVFDLLATDLSVKKIKEALKSIWNNEGLIPVATNKQKSKPKQNHLIKAKKTISFAWDKFVKSSFVSVIASIFLFVFKVLFFIFRVLWEIVSYLPKTFWKYLRQIWSTYKIFMNACPHVAPQRSLR